MKSKDLLSKQLYEESMTKLEHATGMRRQDIIGLVTGSTYKEAESSLLLTLDRLPDKIKRTRFNEAADGLVFVWPYLNSMHFYVPELPDESPFDRDTTILSALQTGSVGCGAIFDISVEEQNYLCDLYTPNNTNMNVGNSDWFCNIYMRADEFPIKPKITSTQVVPIYRIQFKETERLKRVIVHALFDVPGVHEGIQGTCVKCGLCRQVEKFSAVEFYEYETDRQAEKIAGIEFYEYGFYARAHNKDCALRNKWNCIYPQDVILAVTYAISCYINRKEIAYGSTRTRKPVDTPKVHIRHSIGDRADKIVMLPLAEYVKTYEPAKPYEYKGGHHASPISHVRQAFYRKSRGRGDYERQGEDFVYVGDMQGSYSYVSETVVNKDKVADTVTIYQTPRAVSSVEEKNNQQGASKENILLKLAQSISSDVDSFSSAMIAQNQTKKEEN